MNINSKENGSVDFSFYDDDFEESDNVRSASPKNKLAVRSEKAFTNQGDNEAATTDYELTDLEKHNSPNLGAPVQNTSTQAHIELAQSPYNAPLGSNEHSLAELSAHQHDTVGLEHLRSTTIESQLETLPTKLSTSNTNGPKRKQSSRRRSSQSATSHQLTSYYGRDVDMGIDNGELSLDQMNVQELAIALKDLSKSAKFRSVRPPWRDPNSRQLPSDDAACVEEMLREYNSITSHNPRIPRPSFTVPNVAIRRPYHSTLNRWRQQERIQIENFCLASRLRNIRPSRETSRDELLRQHKEYFVTPITARSMSTVSMADAFDVDLESLRSRTDSRNSISIASRPTSSNHRDCTTQLHQYHLGPQKTPARRRPKTSTSGAATGRASGSRNKSANLCMIDPAKAPNGQGDRSPVSCNCTTKRSNSSVRNTELIDSLNSVRKALYEQKQKEQS